MENLTRSTIYYKVRTARRALSLVVGAALVVIAGAVWYQHTFGSAPADTNFYTIIQQRQP